MNHALKIESLDLNQTKADEIETALHVFLLDLGYSQERIDSLECRRRDGFIPFSHNFGGLEAVALIDQEYARGQGGTGFKNADATLEKYFEYDIEYFETDVFKSPSTDWTEKQWDEFYDSRYSDSEASVLYSADLMITGLERGIFSLNIRLCICVKDSPYHRKFDDKLEFDLRFRTVASLKRQLIKLLKNPEVNQFKNCLKEAF